MHRDCIQTCTKHALVVRFEDSTAPYKMGHQRWSGVIPAHAGIQLLSESGPDSTQKDALAPHRMHRDCIQTCTKHALAARFEDSTAPYKIGHQRRQDWIPASAGMTTSVAQE